MLRSTVMVGSFPSQEEIKRISMIADPVIRNLQITQCYAELSAFFTQRTGLQANWCTFATWASKQAGQTIRKEDLRRLLEVNLRESPDTLMAAQQLVNSAQPSDRAGNAELPEQALAVDQYAPAINRASEAVARGNKKVFDEIAPEFARFYQTCYLDEVFDGEHIAHFCETLSPGDPPDGQGYLRRAFSHYYASLFEQNSKRRTELLFLANIEIGFHEQTRLQPEIVESLDAGWTNLRFYYRVLKLFFPDKGILSFAHLMLMRWLGRPTRLDQALQMLLSSTQKLIRQMLTDLMMTITLPPGIKLNLGEDLPSEFPESLRQITNPELIGLLNSLDPTIDSTVDSGAVDWTNLPDRLHFIIDFFRCYQERAELFSPAFTVEQIAVVKSGQLPAGKL
jgi:hypothetical protein